MDNPTNLKYSKTHEWVKLEGNRATIGITAHAADELGDIIFIELPEVGKEVGAEDVCGTVESVKAVSELYAPIAGKVVEVNEGLADSPEQLNTGPFDAGWIAVIEVPNTAEVDALMDAAAYDAFIASGA